MLRSRLVGHTLLYVYRYGYMPCSWRCRDVALRICRTRVSRADLGNSSVRCYAVLCSFGVIDVLCPWVVRCYPSAKGVRVPLFVSETMGIRYRETITAEIPYCAARCIVHEICWRAGGRAGNAVLWYVQTLEGEAICLI